MNTFDELIDAGFSRHREGQLTEAEQTYRAALTLQPGDLNALHLLGTVLLDEGRAIDALAVLEQAADVLERRGDAARRHGALYNNLGNALRLLGRGPDAEVAYRRALDLDPSAVQAHLGLGITLALSGRLEDAAAVLGLARTLDPDATEVLAALGRVQVSRGHFDAAVACFARLASLPPAARSARLDLARALRLAGQHGEELRLLKDLAAEMPQDVPVRLELTESLLARGYTAEASAEASALASSAPENAEVAALAVKLGLRPPARSGGAAVKAARFRTSPLSPSGAVEVTGLDCSRPLAPDTVAEIERLFLDHPVMVFRDQPLTGRQFLAFAENFGEAERFGEPSPLPAPDAAITRADTPSLPETGEANRQNLLVYYHSDDPRVQFMTNAVRHDMPLMGIQDNARLWHVDAQYRERPNKITLLSNVVTPSSGGDTVYSDLTLLFESLPAEMQRLLTGLVGVHQWSKSRNFMFDGRLDDAVRAEGERIAGAVPSMRHPLVCRHPGSGRPVLFISPRFTVAVDGLEPAHSRDLLQMLFAALDDRRFVYRHQWRNGDLVMWDNRRLVHHGYGYPAGEVRHMNSITLHGSRPIPA